MSVERMGSYLKQSRILNDDDGDTKEGILGSPTDKSQRLYSEPFHSTPQTNGGIFSSGKPFKHVTPFGQRTDKFVVKFSTNNMPNAENRENKLAHENNDDDIIRKVQPRERCSLIVHGSGPEPGCRFMYDRIEDRFNALENRIKRHTTALVASGLYEKPVDPTVASQKSIFAVGMICCDGEGHLNEKSILLQSSYKIMWNTYNSSNARVILVPSICDANHDFVFPQPAFEIHSPNLKHQITSLTNPGTFEANQVKIGCCTVDILKHLSGEEMSRNLADGTPIDRMSRLANHILSQRRFYPLYPPAEGIPLDFSLAPESLHISSIPDILILPSDMKYFVKVLSLGEGGEGGEQVKCISVNPGRLAKGEGRGTFAELNYYGGPDTSNASIIGI